MKYRDEEIIHLTELDEFLAAHIVEAEGKPMKLAVNKIADQGYLSVCFLKVSEEMEESGIDFELSPCECIDFETMGISDFRGKAVFTSSAYEFFDFLFLFYVSFECLVDFTGGAWKIKILSK